jgi:transposase
MHGARTIPLCPVPAEVPGNPPTAGLTVADFARRYRVGEDKVRAWIERGELRAVNTAAVLCGKPRWVIPPEALAEFERRRAGGPEPKPPVKRRRRTHEIDYFPD